jgi:hypothetical protein
MLVYFMLTGNDKEPPPPFDHDLDVADRDRSIGNLRRPPASNTGIGKVLLNGVGWTWS